MRALAVLVIAVGLGLTGPAAHAERWAAQDQRGDVTATTYDVEPGPEDDPCAEVPQQRDRGDAERDLRRLAVDHTRESVTITMTMRAVRARSAATYWMTYLRTDGKDYELSVQRYERGGTLEVTLTKSPDLPEPGEIEGCSYAYFTYGLACDGLEATADPARDQIRVVVPRACLKEPRWVSAAASASSTAGPDAAGILTVLNDFWGPRGSTYVDFQPPFGPRVRVS